MNLWKVLATALAQLLVKAQPAPTPPPIPVPVPEPEQAAPPAAPAIIPVPPLPSGPAPIEPPPANSIPTLAVPPQRPNLGAKPFRYLIGADTPPGKAGDISHVGYDSGPAQLGYSTAYGNLFNEKFAEQDAASRLRYGPYRQRSDTAEQYNEGEIDPSGPGWEINLRQQFARRQKQGFDYIELDNPDAYSWREVCGAIDLAAQYGLGVLAKNPGLWDSYPDQVRYVRHSNVYGIIVEKGAGEPKAMEQLRREAGKKMLPVWFVFFDNDGSTSGRTAFKRCVSLALRFANMRCTYSPKGEYTAALEING